VAALAELRADVAFVATNGLTVGHGLTTPDSDEAASKRAIIACARRTVVLADSTKLGVETAVRFATLDSLDVLVTDSDIEPQDRRALEAAGIEVVIA
jgi:DeoR family fructose operon transcriptional repressor